MSPDGKRDKTHETGATHEVWGVQARRRQILRDETYIEVGRRTKDDPLPADGAGQMGVFPRPAISRMPELQIDRSASAR
jgi:hypothetical protein